MASKCSLSKDGWLVFRSLFCCLCGIYSARKEDALLRRRSSTRYLPDTSARRATPKTIERTVEELADVSLLVRFECPVRQAAAPANHFADAESLLTFNPEGKT